MERQDAVRWFLGVRAASAAAALALAACSGSTGPSLGDLMQDVTHEDDGVATDDGAIELDLAPDPNADAEADVGPDEEADTGADQVLDEGEDQAADEADANPDPAADGDTATDAPACSTDDECAPQLPDLGKCDVARCVAGKCVKAAVGCHAPGAPECADDTHLETFLDPGVCDPATGACAYPSVLLPCPDGCVDGVCPGVPRLLDGGFLPGGAVGLDDVSHQGACVMPGWAGGAMKSETYSAIAGFEP